MADFTPITTQEALDEIITKRLARDRAKYADYDQIKAKLEELEAASGRTAELESSLAQLQQQLTEANTAADGMKTTIAEQEARIKRHETDSVKTKIAHEYGLPFEFASRLTGEDEKSIRADADALRRVIGKNNTAPLANPESGETNSVNAGYQSLLAQMRGE